MGSLNEDWRLFCSKLFKIKKTSNGIEALCPAHYDISPSLTASFTKDKILFKCQAGCSFESVVSSMGMETSQFFAQEEKTQPKTIESTYRYEDKDGNHVMDVVRFKPKDFRPQRPDGKWTFWKKNGQKDEERNYKDNDLVDKTIFKYSYFTGHLKSEKRYKDGKCISRDC